MPAINKWGYLESALEEKRSYARYSIWFPVILETPTGQVWGICRDASPGGLMVSSAVTLGADAMVYAIFRLEAKEEDCRIRARIVRCWQNDDELFLAFPFRMAIEFEEALVDMEPRLRRKSEKPPEL